VREASGVESFVDETLERSAVVEVGSPESVQEAEGEVVAPDVPRADRAPDVEESRSCFAFVAGAPHREVARVEGADRHAAADGYRSAHRDADGSANKDANKDATINAHQSDHSHAGPDVN
jgi:hypothetical protein